MDFGSDILVLDFDHHFGAIAEPSAVGLSNRRRGHGDRFEGGEESLERIFEFRLDGRLDDLGRIRWDVGLEHLQFGGLGAADKVGTQGQDLSEFDERGP